LTTIPAPIERHRNSIIADARIGFSHRNHFRYDKDEDDQHAEKQHGGQRPDAVVEGKHVGRLAKEPTGFLGVEESLRPDIDAGKSVEHDRHDQRDGQKNSESIPGPAAIGANPKFGATVHGAVTVNVLGHPMLL